VELVAGVAQDVGRKTPTRWEAALFALKVWILRAQRGVYDLGYTARRWPVERYPQEEWRSNYELRSHLWSDVDRRERRFELGKVENLRRACLRLNGVVIEAGGTFSFWQQVGKASKRKGFVTGRMLQQGCVVPAIGGGLCQLSNALYGLALRSGCEIVERHAHSAKMPNAPIHDATVAWNYIDLRFRVGERTRIKVWMSGEELIVEWQTASSVAAVTSTFVPLDQIVGVRAARQVQSCASCDVTDCFRHETPQSAVMSEECMAYLVDLCSPEFEAYVQRSRRVGDVFARATKAEEAERMAARLAQTLRPEVTHLCVSRSLLPWLWRLGAMGGRTFDVLMTTESAQAADRATGRATDRGLIRDEEEALKAAHRLITLEDAVDAPIDLGQPRIAKMVSA
jgi:hypothetical protein